VNRRWPTRREWARQLRHNALDALTRSLTLLTIGETALTIRQAIRGQ
jgi:hypothetical protein